MFNSIDVSFEIVSKKLGVLELFTDAWSQQGHSVSYSLYSHQEETVSKKQTIKSK